MSFLQDFIRCSSENPCLQCGKTDWCVIHKDGRFGLCQREDTGQPWGDAGWRYDIDEDIALPPPVDPPAPLTRGELWGHYDVYNCHGYAPARLYADEIGVPVSAALRLRVGMSGNVFALPMFDGEGALLGFQFRGFGRKWCLRGGRLGLFGLPVSESSATLFVAEGASDCAALRSLGLEAIGRPSCNSCVGYIEDFIHFTRPGRVVIVADNDEVGIQGAQKLQEALPGSTVIAPQKQYKDARAAVLDGCNTWSVMSAVYGRENAVWTPVQYNKPKAWRKEALV